MHPYFSLQGRTALVTGGTRGIGKMIAKAYVEAGATVYVCARDAEACQQTADELSAFGTCHAVAANLATEEGVLQLATQLGEQKLTVLSLHPGWVKTDMGGEGADIDVETSTRGLVDQVNAYVGKGGHHFVNYRGETIPW